MNFGQFWSILVNFGQLWSILVNFGQLWSTLVNFGQLWSTLVNYFKWISDNNGQLWLVLANFGETGKIFRSFAEEFFDPIFLCSQSELYTFRGIILNENFTSSIS